MLAQRQYSVALQRNVWEFCVYVVTRMFHWSFDDDWGNALEACREI